MAMPEDDAIGSRWQALAELAAIPCDEGRCFEVDDLEIALFRRGAEVYALNNICPHRGAALAEGTINDDEVVCPWHGWRFELATGKCRTLPAESATVYP